MKKFLPLIVLIFMFAFSVQGFAYENGIFDDADLFSASEETDIDLSLQSFSSEKDFSLAVVTADYTSGVSSEEYADDFYDYLIDNEGWQENGLLFLIDMDNRNVWISTYGECILAYSDSEIDDIIDSGYDSLTAGYYADCILSMIEAARLADTVIDNADDYYIVDDESLFGDPSFAGSIVEFNGEMYSVNDAGEWIPMVTESYENGYYGGYYDSDYYDSYYHDDYYDYGSSYRSSSFNITDVLIYIVIGLVIAAIVVFAVKSRYKNMGKGDEFDADDVILNLTASNDNIVSRNVVTTRIPRNNNHHHHGGSRGGGSSVHRSGGGRSHGGGGRRF